MIDRKDAQKLTTKQGPNTTAFTNLERQKQ